MQAIKKSIVRITARFASANDFVFVLLKLVFNIALPSGTVWVDTPSPSVVLANWGRMGKIEHVAVIPKDPDYSRLLRQLCTNKNTIFVHRRRRPPHILLDIKLTII